MGRFQYLPEVTVACNATGGDIISDATAVAMNANRNFGSSKTLSVDAYAGKSGGTITGETDTVLFFQGTGGRLFATINIVVPKGSNITVYLDPKLSSGSIKAYCALVCHLKDEAGIDW